MKEGSREIPILPLRDIVVFPHIIVPLYVGRPKSLKAIQEANEKDKKILLVTQRNPATQDPKTEELCSVGTIALIKQQTKLSDGNLKILVEGLERALILSFQQEEPYLAAQVQPFESPVEAQNEEPLKRTLLKNLERYFLVNGKQMDESFQALALIQDSNRLVDILTSQLPLKLKDKQEILELHISSTRLERLASFLLAEIELSKIDQRIKKRVQEQIEKSQKEHFLQEQLSAIYKELGEETDVRQEMKELQDQLKQKNMPEVAREKALKEINRLKMLHHYSPEVGVIRHYVDLILELPWNMFSQDQTDIDYAEKILEKEHYGLKDVKERILEFLAVRNRTPAHQSPVICFTGPPGVGKTSLARSIAQSLNRKFERVCLGGLRDEAELKGHRRTYIGALPGKIISAIRKAGTSNPVILLDEVDKMGQDFRGDPASALLEILDPEQNKHFADHYLDLEYDLSKVLFIATANTTDPLSSPLQDRMEVIRLSGYTEDEKVAIAKYFLLPKERENHGLEVNEFSLSDEILRTLIRYYTRESGLRALQKSIAKIGRKIVRQMASQKFKPLQKITKIKTREFLGVSKYQQQFLENENLVGVVSGLAWTASGGEILTIEAVAVPGKGGIQITGQLGNVMQESVKTALSYVRSRSRELKLSNDFFNNHEIHVHVPEGAIPKDGPSAGATIALAILSAVLKAPIRRDIGITGEITLRGRILAVGGLKEKLLAAKRVGLKEIFYPKLNDKDFEELEPVIFKGLKLLPVFHMNDIIEKCLVFEEPIATPREKVIQPISPPLTPIAPTVEIHH